MKKWKIILIIGVVLALGVVAVVTAGAAAIKVFYQLEKEEPKKPEKPVEPEGKEPEEVIFKILIEWDGKYPNNNQLIDLRVNVSGTMKDGTTVSMSDDETTMVDTEGNEVGTFKRETLAAKGRITIEIMDAEGTYSLDGNDGRFNPAEWDNEISLSNAKATVYRNGKKIGEYESGSGLCRSYTGYWFWGICGIKEGELIEYDSSWMDVEGWWSSPGESTQYDVETVLSEEEIEKRVEEIRKVYYEIQNNPANYEKKIVRNKVEQYTKDGQICKVVAKAGAYKEQGYDNKYTAQYYYSDGQVVFVFVYQGGEEHRFYFDQINSQKVIRYIDENKKTYNYEKGVKASDISDVGYFCDFAMQELE